MKIAFFEAPQIQQSFFSQNLVGVDIVFYEEKLSLDHILPMSRGGENVKENVAPSHRRCNQNRTDMTISEFDNWIKDVLEFRSSKYGCT